MQYLRELGNNVEPVTGAAMPTLGSAKNGAVPRVGYLVYRVERGLRARLDEELRVHGVSTPEYMTLSLPRERAHSLHATNPSPRPSPLSSRGGSR